MKHAVYIFLFFLIAASPLHAQVGIGTLTPQAKLDITAADNALLIPRVALTSTTDVTTVVNPQGGALPVSTLVYNTATAGTTPNNVAPGFYYWKDTAWQPIAGTGSGEFQKLGNIVRNTTNTSGDHFLFGSTSLNNITGTGDDRRMFFNKDKGAFRAGTVAGTQWNDANVGNNSIASGFGTIASGDNSTAMGMVTNASNVAATAMGRNTIASGETATAMGQNTEAEGNYATAMGFGTKATGDAAVATGINSQAGGEGATAMGGGTEASGVHATAMGRGTTASGPASVAMGYNTEASGDTATAMGSRTRAIARNATAMGENTTAFGSSSTAMGRSSTASGNTSTAMGQGTSASGNYSTAMGFGTNALGDYSMAMGRETRAQGNYATAMGLESWATGIGSTAMGYWNDANGNYSTAMGHLSKAQGIYSTAIGHEAIARGETSFAVGHHADAMSRDAVAIGAEAIADGWRSIALGTYVNTNGYAGSVVVGDGDFTDILSAFEAVSGAKNQFVARFDGGYRFHSSSRDRFIGVQLGHNATSWSTLSDSTRKENYIAADGKAFLEKLKTMHLGSWNYKGQDKAQYRHYGPMAQEFYAHFGNDGIGTIGNDTTIATADIDGVMMIVLQALVKENEELKAENETLKKGQLALQQQFSEQQNKIAAVEKSQQEWMVKMEQLAAGYAANREKGPKKAEE